MYRNCFLTILGVITFISLSSCDPGVGYNRVLQNDSQYDIELRIHKKNSSSCQYVYLSDSIIVDKKSEKILYSYNGLGQTFEFDNCETCADSIVLKVAGNPSLKSTVDLNDPNEWTFRVLKKTFKSGGICECRLIMTDNMIK